MASLEEKKAWQGVTRIEKGNLVNTESAFVILFSLSEGGGGGGGKEGRVEGKKAQRRVKSLSHLMSEQKPVSQFV